MRSVQTTHIELPHLVLKVALREMLNIGELQVHLRQPHQDSFSSSLKVLSLRGEVLQRRRADGENLNKNLCCLHSSVLFL